MLIKLLKRHLPTYKVPITYVIILQFLQTLATLYLPTLNADIIDNGVVKGDTGYIVRIGGVMLAVTLVQIACSIGAVYFGARTAMALGRDVRAAIFDRVQDFSAREVGPVRRAVADHPDHQRRPAGADAGADDLHADGVGADHVRRRHRPGAASRTCRSRRCCWSSCRCSSASSPCIIVRMRPLFRTMQERIDKVNRVLREQITGIRVIRAFVRDDHEQERFGQANDRAHRRLAAASAS